MRKHPLMISHTPLLFVSPASTNWNTLKQRGDIRQQNYARFSFSFQHSGFRAVPLTQLHFGTYTCDPSTFPSVYMTTSLNRLVWNRRELRTATHAHLSDVDCSTRFRSPPPESRYVHWVRVWRRKSRKHVDARYRGQTGRYNSVKDWLTCLFPTWSPQKSSELSSPWRSTELLRCCCCCCSFPAHTPPSLPPPTVTHTHTRTHLMTVPCFLL